MHSLPDFVMERYDISADGKRIVFARIDEVRAIRRCGSPRSTTIFASLRLAAAGKPLDRTSAPSAKSSCGRSSRSRKLNQKRKYHRTQVTITCGSNLRFQNSGGRHDFIGSHYQIRRCNTSLLAGSR